MIRTNNLLQFIHQVTIEIRFRKSLAQERFKSSLEFRNQIIVPSIKFRKVKFRKPNNFYQSYLEKDRPHLLFCSFKRKLWTFEILNSTYESQYSKQRSCIVCILHRWEKVIFKTFNHDIKTFIHNIILACSLQ